MRLDRNIEVNIPILLFFIITCTPQISLKPIPNFDYISTLDLLFPVTVVFLLFRRQLIFSPPQITILLFIFYAIAMFFAQSLYDMPAYQTQLPYIGRLLAVFSVLFLVPYLPVSEEAFIRTGRAAALLCLAATLFIIAMYLAGSDAYNAHQTLTSSTGITFNRLGGLPEESGAYAFNALVVCQLAITFLVLADSGTARKILFLALIGAALFLSFSLSQARIMVANFAAFSGVIFLSGAFRPAYRVAVIILLLGLAGYVSIYGFEWGADLFRRFLSDSGDSLELSTGRFEHWASISTYLLENPAALVFGIGNRMTPVVFGHAVENFALYFALEYGLIGFTLFCTFLYLIIRPILTSAIAGNRISLGLFAIWIAAFMQWQVNDLMTYHQTFPLLIGLSGWWYSILRNAPSAHGPAARAAPDPLGSRRYHYGPT